MPRLRTRPQQRRVQGRSPAALCDARAHACPVMAERDGTSCPLSWQGRTSTSHVGATRGSRERWAGAQPRPQRGVITAPPAPIPSDASALSESPVPPLTCSSRASFKTRVQPQPRGPTVSARSLDLCPVAGSAARARTRAPRSRRFFRLRVCFSSSVHKRLQGSAVLRRQDHQYAFNKRLFTCSHPWFSSNYIQTAPDHSEEED